MRELDELAIGVGDVGNYYGGLSIATKDGKFYWSIENWDGHRWSEIDKDLYDNLEKLKD